jgi:hypothetical protein
VDLFYDRYFHPPVTPDFPADLRGQFYSFNFGSSHFVAVNTNLPYDPASPQYQWLVQDLEKAVRNPNRKFTFVFQHHPVYSAYVRGQNPDGVAYLNPLYQAYDVDAVFAGDLHLYDRSDVQGLPYIITGGGGAPPYCDTLDLALNPYWVTNLCDYEFLLVEVNQHGYDLSAYDINGNLFDQLHYSKP